MDQWTPDSTPESQPEAAEAQPVEAEITEVPEEGAAHEEPIAESAQPSDFHSVEEGDTQYSEEPASEEPMPEGASAGESAAFTEGATTLHIDVVLAEGDLTIVGGAEHVHVNAPHWSSAYDAVESESGVRFNRLPSGTELRTPNDVVVTVREVEGDLRCERLDGELRVTRADGDARVEDVAQAQLHWISGDLFADHVGHLVNEGVGGDTWLANIQNVMTLGRIGGGLEVRRSAGLHVTEAVGGDVAIERCDFATFEGPIGGDAELRRIRGSIHLTSLGGDLNINDVRDLSAHSVGGDVTIDGVSGRATCDTVGGDVETANTFGPLSVGAIGGDLRIERAPGGVSVGRTGGDVTIDTLLRPAAKYVVNAGGDIVLRVRGDVNARFVAQSFGGEIHTRLPLTVEKGRRRNLVGALGTGSATVTLQSGGDISIVAADGQRGDFYMGNEYDDQGNPTGPDDSKAHTFEGAVGGRKFRVRVENAPGRAGFQFKGPYTPEEEEKAREFRFDWERGRGAHTSGEYGEQLNDLRDQAEQLARRAGEEARKYAETAARRARETDWEAVGAEIRTTIERAMADLEDAFSRWGRASEPRGGAGPDASGRPSGGAQRVRIEHDEPAQGYSAGYGAGYDAGASAQPQDRDAMRRQTLEDLRNGRITLDEAERRLNDLH